MAGIARGRSNRHRAPTLCRMVSRVPALSPRQDSHAIPAVVAVMCARSDDNLNLLPVLLARGSSPATRILGEDARLKSQRNSGLRLAKDIFIRSFAYASGFKKRELLSSAFLPLSLFLSLFLVLASPPCRASRAPRRSSRESFHGYITIRT